MATGILLACLPFPPQDAVELRIDELSPFGKMLALAALILAFFVVRGRYLTPLASAVSLSSVRFLPAEVCVLLVVGGMAVGCVGGIVAAWRS